jgi:hypothetical protein
VRIRESAPVASLDSKRAQVSKLDKKGLIMTVKPDLGSKASGPLAV